MPRRQPQPPPPSPQPPPPSPPPPNSPPPRHRRPRKAQQADARISQLILQALSARRQRGGLSLTSLRKALLASGYDAERNKHRVQLAIKSLVSDGSLVQAKATGSLQLKRQPSQQQQQGEALQGEGESQQLPAPPPQEEATSAGRKEQANPARKPRERVQTDRKAKPRKTRR